MIALSCGIKIFAVHCLGIVWFCHKHACVGQTDRQNYNYRASIADRTVKTVHSLRFRLKDGVFAANVAATVSATGLCDDYTVYSLQDRLEALEASTLMWCI